MSGLRVVDYAWGHRPVYAMKTHGDPPYTRDTYKTNKRISPSYNHDRIRCIAFRNSVYAPYAGNRCTNEGRLDLDEGRLCLIHARVWARRGWLDEDALRKILYLENRRQQVRISERVESLRYAEAI